MIKFKTLAKRFAFTLHLIYRNTFLNPTPFRLQRKMLYGTTSSSDGAEIMVGLTT